MITDLLVTELSFDASMCLIDVWLFDLLFVGRAAAPELLGAAQERAASEAL